MTSPSRGPLPGAEHTLFRGYGPFVALVALILAMALLAPTIAPERDVATRSRPAAPPPRAGTMSDGALHRLRGYVPVVALATAFLAVSAAHGAGRAGCSSPSGADAGAAPGDGSGRRAPRHGRHRERRLGGADAPRGPATTRPSGPAAGRRVGRPGRRRPASADEAAAPAEPLGAVTPVFRPGPADPQGPVLAALPGLHRQQRRRHLPGRHQGHRSGSASASRPTPSTSARPTSSSPTTASTRPGRTSSAPPSASSTTSTPRSSSTAGGSNRSCGRGAASPPRRSSAAGRTRPTPTPSRRPRSSTSSPTPAPSRRPTPTPWSSRASWPSARPTCPASGTPSGPPTPGASRPTARSSPRRPASCTSSSCTASRPDYAGGDLTGQAPQAGPDRPRRPLVPGLHRRRPAPHQGGRRRRARPHLLLPRPVGVHLPGGQHHRQAEGRGHHLGGLRLRPDPARVPHRQGQRAELRAGVAGARAPPSPTPTSSASSTTRSSGATPSASASSARSSRCGPASATGPTSRSAATSRRSPSTSSTTSCTSSPSASRWRGPT